MLQVDDAISLSSEEQINDIKRSTSLNVHNMLLNNEMILAGDITLSRTNMTEYHGPYSSCANRCLRCPLAKDGL